MFKTYRNLKNLHSLYEQNFVLINKLSGELNKSKKFSFQVGNLEIKSQISISKKELSKFTDELHQKCEKYSNEQMIKYNMN